MSLEKIYIPAVERLPNKEDIDDPQPKFSEMDILISTNFTQPEDSSDRYTATVVPKYPLKKELSGDIEDRKFRLGYVGKILVSGFLSDEEFQPIEQELNRSSGNSSNPDEAVSLAYEGWLTDLQVDSADMPNLTNQ